MSLEIPIAIVDKESRQPAAAHNTTPGGYTTAWLNAARNRTLGPNRTQEVQEGDSITLMVEGKYLDIKAGAFRPKDLLQPVEGAPAGPLLTDLGQPISAGGINQFLLFKALHLLITGIQQKPAPEAYLGYALYDADSNMYDQGRIVLSKKARNRHEELKTRIFVPKDGYIEAYVVNESDEDVWFDQFRILSTGPVIVQETHYDPWGVELQGLGYQQGGLKVNKYLYNGKEFNDHQGLNLFDYGARLYDAAVGRWFVVDPLAELPSQIAHSPYVYAWNNPVGMIDPTGMAAEESDPGKKGKKGTEDPPPGWEEKGMLYGGPTFSGERIYPNLGEINKSNQNAQAGWGGGGNSGGSGDYISPNIEYAKRYFDPNRPLSTGAVEPFYFESNPLEAVISTFDNLWHGNYVMAGLGVFALIPGGKSVRGMIKSVGLPVSGKIRFIPRNGWTPTQPLTKGPNGGYLDRFGNEWTKKKVAGKGPGEIHWDVQLSPTGKSQLGHLSNSGSHLNVTSTGQIAH